MYTRKWLSMSSQFYLIPNYESAAKSKQNKKFKNSDQAANLPENAIRKLEFLYNLKKAVASRHCYHEMRRKGKNLIKLS